MAIYDSNATYGDDKTAIADVLDNEGLQGVLVVGLTAVEIKVGASRLSNRKLITAYNNSNSIIYWGYNSSVTSATGTPIEKKQFQDWPIGQNLTIFLIADSINNNVRITEAS